MRSIKLCNIEKKEKRNMLAFWWITLWKWSNFQGPQSDIKIVLPLIKMPWWSNFSAEPPAFHSHQCCRPQTTSIKNCLYHKVVSSLSYSVFQFVDKQSEQRKQGCWEFLWQYDNIRWRALLQEAILSNINIGCYWTKNWCKYRGDRQKTVQKYPARQESRHQKSINSFWNES